MKWNLFFLFWNLGGIALVISFVIDFPLNF